MITSRELAMEALAHRVPQRIPWTLYVAKPLVANMEKLWGSRENWPCPPDDLVRILWDVETEEVGRALFRDRFGCEWKREHGGYVFVNPPLAEPDASQIPRIQLINKDDVRLILETRRRKPDKFIFYQFTATLGERLWNLRGMDNTMMDYLSEPKFVHAALDRLLEMHFEALEKILPLPIDGVTFGDDYGSQRGLMISREVFLRFYKPRLAKLYEKVRSAGKVVGHHSCGDNTPILGDFVDIGLQVFHPLQPEAMDIQKAKSEFGKHLTFRGGIGTQRAMVFGTPEQARTEVCAAVKILAEDGGYFLETAKPIPEETPVENAVAVIEELIKAMAYVRS
jgi:uroporphyrinogen decarboxylase